MDCNQSPHNAESEKDTSGVTVTKNFGQRVQNKAVLEESTPQRRYSSRLKERPRPYYGTSGKELSRQQRGKFGDRINSVDHSKQVTKTGLNGEDNVADKELNDDSGCLKDNGEVESSEKSDVGVSSVSSQSSWSNKTFELGSGDEKWLKGCLSPSNIDGKSAHAKVKDTLRIFNQYYLQLLQEEEKKCENTEADAQASKRKRDDNEKDVKTIKRLDLKALSKMFKSKEIMYPARMFGHLPGIDVGHQFYSRAEMVALGVHNHWLHGIDFIGASSQKQEGYRGYTFPLAVAIVLSGEYEDDQDNSEDVIYTGQGGNDFTGKRHQVKDQVLSRGNLALKNNMEQSVPVRVIRGHKSSDQRCRKVYTYDGLYKVVEYWFQSGVSGFLVYKYRLKRLEGQPNLKTDKVYFSRGHLPNVPSSHGLICSDISEGQEEFPIPVVNVIDDTPIAPAGFTYSRSIQFSDSVDLPAVADGCKCKGNCTNPNICACARLNGSDFPYVRSNGGRLIKAMDVVFECGPSCSCGSNCINRVSQQGIKYQLEVFRTQDKGWAVRSREFIPPGAPVCEYVGLLKRNDELDNVEDNDYIFEIDCLHTMEGIEGRERRLIDVSASVSNQLEKKDYRRYDPEFCIDARTVGNIARFINHSCEPNLFVQCVLSSHHDIRLARVVLFAAERIAPLEELTYDYNYALDSVIGADGKIKEQPCHCRAAGCRKRLY